jgi:hypothetical protein
VQALSSNPRPPRKTLVIKIMWYLFKTRHRISRWKLIDVTNTTVQWAHKGIAPKWFSGKRKNVYNQTLISHPSGLYT